MPKYRNALPQMDGGIFLSDGGLETTLIFHDGMQLPHFASFVLLDTEAGRQQAEGLLRAVSGDRRARGVGFVLDTATWRANPDWGAKLGYDADALKAINIASIALLDELRAEWESAATPCVISGAIGPRGDGYKAGNMDAAEAEAYHAAQIAAFADTERRHGVRPTRSPISTRRSASPAPQRCMACLARSRSRSRPTAGW